MHPKRSQSERETSEVESQLIMFCPVEFSQRTTILVLLYINALTGWRAAGVLFGIFCYQ